MSGQMSQLHVAQQSRRDKLRYHQNLDSTNYGNSEDYLSSLGQLSVHQRVNKDSVSFPSSPYGNISFDPKVSYPSAFNFITSSQAVLAHTDDVFVNEESTIVRTNTFPRAEDASFTNSSQLVSSNFDNLARVTGEPHNYISWKRVDAQESCTGGLSVIETNAGLMNVDMKPSFYSYNHVVHPFVNNQSVEVSSENSKKLDEYHHTSSARYQNTLQEVVTLSTMKQKGLEVSSLAEQNIRDPDGSWQNRNGLLLPTRSNRVTLGLNNDLASVSGELGVSSGMNIDRDFTRDGTEHSANVLSLSLSSVSTFRTHVGQIGGKATSENLYSKTDCLDEIGDAKISNFRVGNSTFTCRNAVPLGPFTGYATILKSSKFLRPALQLLDEFRNLAGLELHHESDNVSEEGSFSGDAINASRTKVGVTSGDPSSSSSTLGLENECFRSSSCSYEPDYLRRNAMMMFLLEQVGKRYNQYQQQIQLVISSFESVAGLSAATPYITLSLKTVSTHFHRLKNAIADQLRSTRKALGDKLLSPTARALGSKYDPSTSSFGCIDQTFPKMKFGGGNSSSSDPPHIWRPQRGLPERAVAVLRAWLFDHFLHPYPTDMDKHMLATQTGLTRNQVSNWFINARVRIWKPMVEEIHQLEAKETTVPGQNPGKVNDQPSPWGSSRLDYVDNLVSGEEGINYSSPTGDGSNADMWNQENLSRTEFQDSEGSSDRSFLGSAHYHNELEIGRFGGVSLTLGLRQSADGVSASQQQQFQFRQEFGGQMM